MHALRAEHVICIGFNTQSAWHWTSTFGDKKPVKCVRKDFNSKLSLNKMSVGISGICIDRQIRADSVITLWWSCAQCLEGCHKLWFYNKDEDSKINLLTSGFCHNFKQSCTRTLLWFFFVPSESKLCYLRKILHFLRQSCANEHIKCQRLPSSIVSKQREQKRV